MFLSAGKPIETIPLPEEIIRFLGKVEVISVPGSDVHGCWRWKGGKITGTEYGRVCIRNRYYRAHRVSFRWFVGPLAENEDVHHRCHHEWCVNPRHLEAMPHNDHSVESGKVSAAGMICVQFLRGTMDGVERRYHRDHVPEVFQIRSHGREDTYLWCEDQGEFVYNGYRRIKKR